MSEPPQSLTAIPTNTTVTLTWSPPVDANGVISRYLISLSDSMSTLVQNQTVISSTQTVELIELVPFTYYSVSILALTGSGSIEGMAATESFMTDEGGERLFQACSMLLNIIDMQSLCNIYILH